MVVVNTLTWHPWLGRLGFDELPSGGGIRLRFGKPGMTMDAGGLVRSVSSQEGFGGLVGNQETMERSPCGSVLEKSRCAGNQTHRTGMIPRLRVMGLAGGLRHRPDVCWAAAAKLATPPFWATCALTPHEAGPPLVTVPGSQPSARGRSFLTRGPLLNLTINGQPPVKVIDVPAKECGDSRALQAVRPHPFHHIELALPRRDDQRVSTGSPASARSAAALRWKASGFLLAECWSAEDVDEPPLAFVSAIACAWKATLSHHLTGRPCERCKMIVGGDVNGC